MADSKVRGFVMESGELRQLPKHALSLEEVIWSYGGSVALVKELREIGALKPVPGLSRLVFDADDVALVWQKLRMGAYQSRLKSASAK